jgi:hypothetical protein
MTFNRGFTGLCYFGVMFLTIIDALCGHDPSDCFFGFLFACGGVYYCWFRKDEE